MKTTRFLTLGFLAFLSFNTNAMHQAKARIFNTLMTYRLKVAKFGTTTGIGLGGRSMIRSGNGPSLDRCETCRDIDNIIDNHSTSSNNNTSQRDLDDRVDTRNQGTQEAQQQQLNQTINEVDQSLNEIIKNNNLSTSNDDKK